MGAPGRAAPRRAATHRAAVLAAAALLGGLLVPPAPGRAQDGERPVRERTTYQDLQMFSQVLNQIRVNHPDELDTHRLFMAAVEGLVRAADPHSYVIPFERLSPDKEKALRDGKLVPVPIAFRDVGGAFVVVSVHPGSEAMALDILPGDELVAVDDEPVRAGSVDELELNLAGAPGSEVALALERRRSDGSLARLERTVRREKVDPASAIPVATLLEPGTGYVRITTFGNSRVADDLHDALGRLEKQGMERLVLDLRDNGGGLLDQAAAVAGEFLPRGTLVYTTEGRKEAVTDTARVRRSFWRSERDYPIVLLVDEGTASASEVVAGALQDHDRALIVGRTTFGKSLVMQGFPLTDGSIMVLVIGTVRTPCGRSIQREYRSVSTRDYYRAAAREREVAGRPSCTTAGGRTVYGGGGIVPDRSLPPVTTPRWLALVHEQDLLLRWTAGFVEGRRDEIRATLAVEHAAPRLPQGALDAFLAFAAEQDVTIPDDDDARQRLATELALRLAHAAGGAPAYFLALARTDPEVQAAVQALDEAGGL